MYKSIQPCTSLSNLYKHVPACASLYKFVQAAGQHVAPLSEAEGQMVQWKRHWQLRQLRMQKQQQSSTVSTANAQAAFALGEKDSKLTEVQAQLTQTAHDAEAAAEHT